MSAVDWAAAGWRQPDPDGGSWCWGDDYGTDPYLVVWPQDELWLVGGGNGDADMTGEFDLEFNTEAQAFEAATYLAAVAGGAPKVNQKRICRYDEACETCDGDHCVGEP